MTHLINIQTGFHWS